MDRIAREGEHRGLGSRGVDGKAARVAGLERERKNQCAGKIMSQRGKPRQAEPDWLDGFIDMQAHVLNAFATAVSNDNNPYCQGCAAAEFQIGLIAAIHRAIPRPNMM